MNAPRSLRLALLGCLAACLGACASDIDHKHPKVMHDVLLASGHAEHAVLMERATGVRFLLPPPPPGSGLAWELVGDNVRVLEQTSGLVPRTDGVEGVQITFFSLKPGRSLVSVVLIDPNAREAVPRARYEAFVTVKADDE